MSLFETSKKQTIQLVGQCVTSVVNLYHVKFIEMYTLLHGFYKYMVQKDEYCVLILGLDDAGKTVSEKLRTDFRRSS